jgi:hypothetical protein
MFLGVKYIAFFGPPLIVGAPALSAILGARSEVHMSSYAR